MLIAPRSSLGFKHRITLDNTIGIIDSDYYNNKNNEGHIFIRLHNDSNDKKDIFIKTGDAFAQGIFINYITTYDDVVENERIGGIGSTSL